MILIALGANLPSPVGPPAKTLRAALAELEKRGVRVLTCSRFFETSPVPASDQPDFVNAVAEVATDLPPDALLGLLHDVEAAYGRTRAETWEARTLDLDLLAYHETVTAENRVKSWGSLVLPHPRLHERHFVLVPLSEVAPAWLHPVWGKTAAALLAELPEEGTCAPLADQS